MNSAHLSDLIYCSAKPFSGSSSVETAQSLQAGHAFTLLSFLCSSFRLEASLGETKRYISTGLQKLPESFSVRLTSKSCSCLYFSEEMVMQASSCIFTETGCWEMHLLREKYSFIWLGLPRSPLKINDIFTGRGGKNNRHTTDWPESLERAILGGRLHCDAFRQVLCSKKQSWNQMEFSLSLKKNFFFNLVTYLAASDLLCRSLWDLLLWWEGSFLSSYGTQAPECIGFVAPQYVGS